jgi:transcriptional regulator with XRE-family HTH domain
MAEAPMRRLLTWAGQRGTQAIEEGPPPQALLKLRQLLGLTQLSLAAKLGLKEAQVRRMETGNMPVSMPAGEQYRRLAAEHGVDLDRLAA